MKKIMVISVVMLTLFVTSGCSYKETETTTQQTATTQQTETTAEQTEKPTEASEAINRDILDSYKEFAESETVDLVKMSVYLMDNIDKVTAETADSMLQVYEKAQMQLLPSYQDSFLAESVQGILLTYTIEDLRENQVKEEPVLALLTESAAVGYKIEAIEGTIAPYVDYGYFAQFADFTTEPTSAFYTLMKTESDNPSQKDAGLLIPWKDVLKRGINFEAYLDAYPSSFYEDRVRMHLEGYKDLAINGSANVPLFDYDTNEMNVEAKTAYIAFVDQGLNTAFATLIKSYVDLLETYDFIKTAEVEDFMKAWN